MLLGKKLAKCENYYRFVRKFHVMVKYYICKNKNLLINENSSSGRGITKEDWAKLKKLNLDIIDGCQSKQFANFGNSQFFCEFDYSEILGYSNVVLYCDYLQQNAIVSVEISMGNSSNLVSRLRLIAKSINAYLLNENGETVGDSYISELKIMEDLLGLGSNIILKHTFYKNAKWMALRCENVNSVLKYFKLSTFKTMRWDEVFEQESHNSIIVSSPIHGWIFLIGHYLFDIFPPLELEGKEILNKHEHLENLSKEFKDVQVYINNEKFGIKYFAKALNGKFVYSWSFDEFGLEEEGVRPSDLDENCSDFNIGTVAAKWSVNPYYFPFYKSLNNAEVYVYYMPSKSLEERWGV